MLTVFRWLPIIDVALSAFWFWSIDVAWSHISPESADREEVDERSLGATVITTQLNGVITGASILIAGVAAFVALKGSLPEFAAYDALWSAVWAVVALGIALYTLGILPARTPTENFVRSREVALFCGMALFFCLASGARFALAVLDILFL